MTEQKPGLRTLEPKLVKRLLETQDPNGGWAEHPGAGLSSFNTAEAIMALSLARSASSAAAAEQGIRQAVEFLLKEHDRARLPHPDSGAWYRSCSVAGVEHKGADIIRTAMAIPALMNAGQRSDAPAVADAIDWLIGRQNEVANDSGWGYQRGAKSKVLPTCFALLALIAASPSATTSPWRDSIDNGLKHLTERFRQESGCFGTGLLSAAHTAYSCLVLQAARAKEFRTVASAENEAIRWLLSNQDDALSPVEEKIELDPSGEADYWFMFSMEALLLRVLGNSQEADHRDTTLWLDAQRRMRDDFDPNTGGFYGRRVFSWSTANGLYSIKASEHNLRSIPRRPAEDPGRLTVGSAIFFLDLALVGAVVYLTAASEFTILQASFFAILVLASLLAYGKIGESTFRELFLSISMFSGKKKRGNTTSSNA